MRAALMSIALAAVMFGPSALADTSSSTDESHSMESSSSSQSADQSNKGGMPGEVGTDTSATSVVSEKQVHHGMLSNESFGMKPEAGLIAFTDPTGNSTSRGALGLGIDWNLTNTFYSGSSPLYLGVQTGAIWSHMGSATSNFFGANPDSTVTNPGANMLIIPADIKLGYAFMDNLRLSVHGGGNVTYRSIANSVDFGSSSFGTGSIWRLFPNVGGDVDIGFGNSVALTLRPDVTLTPGNTLFSGMIGLGVALG